MEAFLQKQNFSSKYKGFSTSPFCSRGFFPPHTSCSNQRPSHRSVFHPTCQSVLSSLPSHVPPIWPLFTTSIVKIQVKNHVILPEWMQQLSNWAPGSTLVAPRPHSLCGCQNHPLQLKTLWWLRAGSVGNPKCSSCPKAPAHLSNLTFQAAAALAVLSLQHAQHLTVSGPLNVLLLFIHRSTPTASGAEAKGGPLPLKTAP